jgi:hypothetical protein
MTCPHYLFVFGKCRIKGSKAAAFVVVKYFFIGVKMVFTGREKDEPQRHEGTKEYDEWLIVFVF